MILTFIGKDGSMGLIYGKKYKVNIKAAVGYIWVEWVDIDGHAQRCPYSSPQSFADNWRKM